MPEVAEKTFLARVTQYLTPDGRQREFVTPLPVDAQEAYGAMVASGCKLEAEVLTTGQVSVTISNGDFDVDIEITPNGPQVQDALVKMLKRKRWLDDDINDGN